MRALVLLIATISFLNGATARSSETTLAQFDHVAITTEGTQSLRRIELPVEMLLKMQRADRRDLQVFNASEQPVPGKLVSATRESSTERQHRPLSYFPVNRQMQQGSARYSFQFSDDGKQTSINLSAPEGAEASAVNDYIIHVNRDKHRSLGSLVDLQFDWQATDENLLVSLLIEGSNDLKTWKTLARDAVLSNLKHDGALLIRDQVSLQTFSGEYLRITWPTGSRPLILKGITGSFSRRKSKPLPWRQTSIACVIDDDSDTCSLDVGRVPVETIQLLLPESVSDSDYFLQGKLFSRAQPERQWINRGAIQQYALTVDNKQIVQSRNAFPRNSDPLWKVTFDPGTLQPYPAAAEVRWRPIYLVFVAQGPGPFKVAFGSNQAAAKSSRTVDTILKRSEKTPGDLELVGLSSIQDNVVVTEFWTRARIETFGLWAVLILGVGVLFWIAMGLFRRMNDTADTHT
jgi:hypothetical protein